MSTNGKVAAAYWMRIFATRRRRPLTRGRLRLLTSLSERGGFGPERGGLVGAAERVEENGVVLAGRRQFRMVRRQAVVQDGNGALVERLGLRGAAGVSVEEPGQVVEPSGDGGVLGA